MFGTKLKPRPLSIEGDPLLAVDFCEDYNQLAKKIGIQARILVPGASLIHAALRSECISVYDLAKVERYMDSKGHWGWFPLRDQDVGYVSLVHRDTPTSLRSLYGSVTPDVYPGPVPMPVLLTVDRLVQRIEATVCFYIAAVREHPDPFLAVMTPGQADRRLYVIERWNEPSFR